MTPVEQFDALVGGGAACLALAPMQDVTDRAFWELIARYGGADLYFTEYFRVYAGSRLDRAVLRSITENPTGRPVVAQLIGNDIGELKRTVRDLEQHAVAAIDLNLGCPAPVVYRKCAGGGLLRDPDHIDVILGALRDVITTRFSVKTRVGFDSAEGFERLLRCFARHGLDLLTVHGRTVREMYRSGVRYDLIRRAAEVMPCPVLANGNISSPAKAVRVLEQTGVCGLMIGRGVVRNPWLFTQIRQALAGEQPGLPTGREVLAYVRALFESLRTPSGSERGHVTRVKKHMNFLGVGVEPSGDFLHRVRRAGSATEFFGICEEYLDHDRCLRLEPLDLDLAAR